MNLSVKDVAGLLNVSDKTIYRMIQSETIPCYRVGGQWRFDRREIKSWIEDTREFSCKTTGNKLSSGDEEAISIAEFLHRGGIYHNVAGNTRESALQACLELIKEGIPEMDTKRLFGSIMERESLCPTAVGHGIALPHPRLFGKFLALSYVALCFLAQPVPFGALDNEDVDTLFFIFPKNERRFLRIQSKLLRLLKEDEVLAIIRKTSPADDIYAVVSCKESEIFRGAAQ